MAAHDLKWVHAHPVFQIDATNNREKNKGFAFIVSADWIILILISTSKKHIAEAKAQGCELFYLICELLLQIFDLSAMINGIREKLKGKDAFLESVVG